MIIGVGTDIVDSRRFMVSDMTLESYAKGMLGKDEVVDFMKSTDKRMYLANQFSAKEALIKASGLVIPVSELQIMRHPSGAPYVKSAYLTGYKIHLSISGEKEYSVAFAIVEDETI